MKIPVSTNCITVGQLVRELSKFKKKYSESHAVFVLPDDKYCYVTGMVLDQDKNLKIMIEEENFDGGYYEVDMFLSELDSYNSNTKVYLAGCGLYLTILTYNGPECFSYNEFDDFVGCDTSVFGEYDDSNDGNYSFEQHLTDCVNRKKRHESLIECIVLLIIAILLAIGFVYSTIAIFTHVWSSVIWSIVCLALFLICAMTLYYDSKN